ncbi:hypothetical protein H6G04_18820 [Calothrix membranacea FACHB-236]|nr:hypothetical protein [Calothrix membranacea FACHB-236]
MPTFICRVQHCDRLSQFSPELNQLSLCLPIPCTESVRSLLFILNPRDRSGF